MTNSIDTMSLLAALQLAKGYVSLGHHSYNELSDAFYTVTKDNTKLPSHLTTQAIVAAMVLSFAIEIYLKALAFQKTGVYTKGHSLGALVQNLPADTQAAIKRNYESIVAEKRNYLHLRFELSVSTSSTAADSNSTAQSEPSSLHKGNLKHQTFEEAIELTSPLFVKLRYFHEDARNGFVSEIDFRCLFYLLDSIRSEIHKDASARVTQKIVFSTSE